MQDVGGWGLKLEVLRLMVALTINWRKLVQPHMPALLQQCWAMFNTCLPLYQQAVILAEEDSDEAEVNASLRAQGHWKGTRQSEGVKTCSCTKLSLC